MVSTTRFLARITGPAGRLAVIGPLLFAAACAAAPEAHEAHETASHGAPLLDGMGEHHRPVGTRSESAQRYFDQGLVLAWGFNHAEAARSFREASRLDPECAMCFWGEALVLGPNINAAMEDGDVPAAWSASRRALELSAGASPVERALIEALAERYAPEPVEDRRPLDEAYAAAMRDVEARFPHDADVVTLLAEALMDLHPWDFWTREGEAQPWTPEVLETLESAIALDSDHPGAHHLYIHAVEASPEPGRAEASADMLRDLVPGAGHLVHMPAHIYQRVGRYADASSANERAIAADDAYATQCHAQGLYPLAYMPHNYHFLWASSTMEGRGKVALESARAVAARVDRNFLREPGYGTLQHYLATPLFALTRFGRWQEILAEPAPDADLVYPTGVWRYARGSALTALGRLDEAAAELAELERIAADPALDGVTIWDINDSAAILAIAREVLAGELAAKRGEFDAAVARLRRAATLERELNYDEPSPWHYPVRHSLGAVLLAAGRPADAEAVYREDLARNPENGWSLHGLAASLREQGRADEATAAAERFAQAWAAADVELTTSRR